MRVEVIDVPQPNDCQNCTPCMRIKLMEMGFVHGQEIEVEKKRLGLYLVHMLSDGGQIAQTIALRQDEFDRICLKEKL